MTGNGNNHRVIGTLSGVGGRGESLLQVSRPRTPLPPTPLAKGPYHTGIRRAMLVLTRIEGLSKEALKENQNAKRNPEETLKGTLKQPQ